MDQVVVGRFRFQDQNRIWYNFFSIWIKEAEEKTWGRGTTEEIDEDNLIQNS